VANSPDKPEIDITLPPKPDPTRGAGGWPLVLDHVHPWAYSKDAFSISELDALINIGNETELLKASTYGSVQSDKNRNSHVSFLYPHELTNWAFAKMAGIITNLNSSFFEFDLWGMEQGLQFTRYEAPGQHYDWHADSGYGTPTRKLSLSVQLNDPSEFKGGELELMLGRKPVKIKPERGLVVSFPSYALHRVKPVTKGVRYSLVCWVSGPPFK
jgi:PKHD-type hydroxylase